MKALQKIVWDEIWKNASEKKRKKKCRLNIKVSTNEVPFMNTSLTLEDVRKNKKSGVKIRIWYDCTTLIKMKNSHAKSVIDSFFDYDYDAKKR